MLLGCAAYAGVDSLPLFIPGEISRRKLRFVEPVVVYASPNNTGALEVAARLEARFPEQLHVTTRPPSAVLSALGPPYGLDEEAIEPTVMLLYLNGETYMGDAGEKLAAELLAVQKAESHLLMLHENDQDKHGCEFGVYFDGRTPDELLQGGIYKALAIALYPGAYQPVSLALAAVVLGAIDESSLSGKLWGGLLHAMRTPWAKARGLNPKHALKKRQTEANVGFQEAGKADPAVDSTGAEGVKVFRS